MIDCGWVDIQVNGHRGVDFSDPELTEERFIRAAEELLSEGTEIFLPTIVTSPLEVFRRNGGIIRQAVERRGLQKQIPGLHFEGPFISNVPGAVGAHNPDWVLPPSPENVTKLLDTVPGFIRIVSLGADADGAPEAIKLLRERGIVVSCGHHLATAAQVRQAADAGALMLTHLGNGCPGMIDRHRNPIYAGLAEDRLIAGIITDGHHLPAELIKIILRVKGPDHTVIISDASSITGFPPGEYSTLGNRAVLTPEGKLYNPEKQCLVGSASTLRMCMKFLDSLELLTADELRRVGRENALKILGIRG